VIECGGNFARVLLFFATHLPGPRQRLSVISMMSFDYAAVMTLSIVSRALEAMARGPFRRRLEKFDHAVIERMYRHGYRLVSSLKNAPVFLNYGIVVPVAGEAPKLKAEDEPDRLFIQLYHRATAGIVLRERDVLEVSCGHGGGARYIAHYMQPRRMVGVDINAKAVAFCRGRHSEPGLEFTVGNAVDLPFTDSSFDAVINIEASHRYPSFETFLREVHRVLRPGGHLMLVDLRWDEDTKRSMLHALQQSGMSIVSKEDLTSRVVASLDEYAAQRRAMIVGIVPRPLWDQAFNDAALPGTAAYQAFVNRWSNYQRFLLRKPTA
jgi:SAM-dependent methyltransferase